MSLGDNLKRLRIDRGMTQGDLSNKSGVGLGQVSNKADPTASTIYKLITALDCSADRLIHDKDKTGLTGLLKEQFERVSGLPQRDQEDLIRIMDKFCVANGLKTMLDEHRVLIGISGDSGVKAVI
jgi:transcriptional regulator with XRE-family HTH domain